MKAFSLILMVTALTAFASNHQLPPPLPADLRAVAGASPADISGLASGSREALERQRQWVEKLGLPLEAESMKSGIAFRLIPPGEFTMGSPSSEKDRDSDESQRRVTISRPFYVGKFEVTQAQWRRVMGYNPSHFKGDDLPVESVSWEDCQAFLDKLCALEGVPRGTYCLLTEAEWEYACRAGTQTAFYFGNSLDSNMANFDGNYPYNASKGVYRKTTTRVGSFKPNAFGLYDMHGNVWEWCSDWYDAYPSGNAVDPSGGGSGSALVYRGGSWGIHARFCRSAYRSWPWASPGTRGNSLGFRLARNIPAGTE